jgi:voltage-gated potassium channel
VTLKSSEKRTSHSILFTMNRTKIYQVLQGADAQYGRIVSTVLLVSIVASVVCVVFESMDQVMALYSMPITVVNTIAVSVFVIEYIARIWTCTEDPRYQHPVGGRLRYMVSPMMIIDALAILPSILFGIGIDLRSLRLLRSFRLFRVLKLARYVAALDTIKDVLHKKKHQLVMTVGIVFFLLLITSSLMYELEHEAQPQEFSSIPATMWWAVASLTTVGYGDIYPITALGKLLAAVTAVLGVGLVALPAGILASGFSSEISQGAGPMCAKCGDEMKSNHT